MPNYTRPTQFTTGQLLGRANLGTLRDNDDFFWGLAHGWRAIPGNVSDTDNNGTIFDGWHYYKTDAKDLKYLVTMDAGFDPGSRVRLYYDYGGTHGQHIVVDPNSATTVSGSFDIIANDTAEGYGTRAEGLYRVACIASGGCTGYCRPVWTAYSGDYGYSRPPLTWDDMVSTASFFNRCRSNDIYFNACKPTNVAFSGMRRSGASVVCWDGWDFHHGTRLYYRVVLPSNWDNGTDRFLILYDYGGSNQETVLSTYNSGTYESFHNLTGSFTPGQRYRVACTVDSGRLPDVQYLFIEPQTTDPGPGMSSGDWMYYLMDDLTVGDYVLGLTLGEGTALQLLREADRHIFSALCASAKVGRRDFAVRSPSVSLDSVAYTGDLRIVHRYDTLVYRTTDGEMAWGSETQSLDDYGSAGYQTLDLRGLDLSYGEVYKVTGGPVDYAAEIP